QVFAEKTCEIRVSEITNSLDDDGVTKLVSGNTHRITMFWDASCADTACVNYAPSIALTMWSPDGAQWNHLQGAVTPAWKQFEFGQTFINHFYLDSTQWLLEDPATGPCRGNVGDSVAVLWATVAIFKGLTGGYTGDLTTLEFQSSEADKGKHICIDTVRVPGGTWGWWNASCGHIIPEWNVQTCYQIVAPVEPVAPAAIEDLGGN
ncbi:MAG: hypothetical protein DRP45_12250, partial [Candidatus Zixiibacteriota bacterium]